MGDKTRMPSLSAHPSAYIRSSPNQGDPGGVIGPTLDTVRLCECSSGRHGRAHRSDEVALPRRRWL